MIYFKLSNPVTQDELEQAYKDGLLKISDLIDGKYYEGKCRNASVAMWDAKKQCFVYMRSKFGQKFPETIQHPANDNRFDLFTPVKEVIPTESQIISKDYWSEPYVSL